MPIYVYVCIHYHPSGSWNLEILGPSKDMTTVFMMMEDYYGLVK